MPVTPESRPDPRWKHREALGQTFGATKGCIFCREPWPCSSQQVLAEARSRARTDLAETLCFLWPQDEHRNHVAKGLTTCEASRGFADRIVRALAARYSVRYAKAVR